MSEISYLPLIEDMVWSYSRVNCFAQCPYSFYLKYISKDEPVNKFYTSYGSFMHKIIEEFYRGVLNKQDMVMRFLTGFSSEVEGERPSASIVNKYIGLGVEYLKGFKEFNYEMVDVEKKVKVDISGYSFIGFIDYLGIEDGEFIIVDNKSRDLKPRSGRAKPTAKDKELDDMLKQLYIYAGAVKQEYGKFPKKLCFNCFKNGVFIEEEFKEEAYEEAIQWAIKQIELIKLEDEFPPNLDFFFCRYLCDVSHECVFYEQFYPKKEARLDI